MKHAFKMLLGCGLALFAVFLLPALGAGDGVTFGVFFILMIACHLFMGHGGHGDGHGGGHGAHQTGQPGGSVSSPGDEEADRE